MTTGEATATPHRMPWGDLLEVITAGLPFCAFKALVGMMLIRNGHRAEGSLLVLLGGADGLLNGVNLVSLALMRRRLTSPCVIAALTRRLPFSGGSAWVDLGNSLDVLLSFCLVAAMVALGLISDLAEHELTMWNAAVVLNVLGAGLARVGASLRRLPDRD